jgi:hypothetical protein
MADYRRWFVSPVSPRDRRGRLAISQLLSLRNSSGTPIVSFMLGALNRRIDMLGLTEYVTRPRRGPLALYGGLGALYGAAGMSLVRLSLRRVGLIDKMVPQALTEWASQKLGVEPPLAPAGHPVADQLVHLAYSLMWGVLAAPLLFATGRRRTLGIGATFGLGLWALGPMFLFPLLKIAPPAWKSSTTENLTNIGTHLIYGLAVQLVTEEAARQRERGASSDVTRHLARIG